MGPILTFMKSMLIKISPLYKKKKIYIYIYTYIYINQMHTRNFNTDDCCFGIENYMIFPLDADTN